MSFQPNPRIRGNVIQTQGSFKISRTKQYQLWDRLMQERRKAAQNYIQVAQNSGKFTAPVIKGPGAYGVSRFMRMKRSRRMIGFGRDILPISRFRRSRRRSRSSSSSSTSSSRSRSRVRSLTPAFLSPPRRSFVSPRGRRITRSYVKRGGKW